MDLVEHTAKALEMVENAIRLNATPPDSTNIETIAEILRINQTTIHDLSEAIRFLSQRVDLLEGELLRTLAEHGRVT